MAILFLRRRYRVYAETVYLRNAGVPELGAMDKFSPEISDFGEEDWPIKSPVIQFLSRINDRY